MQTDDWSEHVARTREHLKGDRTEAIGRLALELLHGEYPRSRLVAMLTAGLVLAADAPTPVDWSPGSPAIAPYYRPVS